MVHNGILIETIRIYVMVSIGLLLLLVFLQGCVTVFLLSGSPRRITVYFHLGRGHLFRNEEVEGAVLMGADKLETCIQQKET